jgi:hypothetical protein
VALWPRIRDERSTRWGCCARCGAASAASESERSIGARRQWRDQARDGTRWSAATFNAAARDAAKQRDWNSWANMESCPKSPQRFGSDDLFLPQEISTRLGELKREGK